MVRQAVYQERSKIAFSVEENERDDLAEKVDAIIEDEVDENGHKMDRGKYYLNLIRKGVERDFNKLF